MKSYLIKLVLVLVCLTVAQSTVYKEIVYDVTSLTEDVIHVDIRSNIPGTIRWTFNDEDYLKVFVNISAGNQDLLDDISIFYKSNSSACTLHLDSIKIQKTAAVTGTGNKSGHVIVLIWLTLFILDWRYMHVLMVLLVANGLVQCMAAQSDTHKGDIHVDLEIRAPRRFRFKDSSLVVNDGRVRLMNVSSQQEDLSGIFCSTTMKAETGCDTCCHGNGFCANNICLCDEGFDSYYNCSVKIRDDIYFNHPLDPRLVRAITSSGDVITLNDISNSEDKIGKIKNPELVYLDIKSKLSKATVFFSSDGFLKKIDTHINHTIYSLQVKRSRDQHCKVTLLVSEEGASKFLFDIDACGESMKMNLRNPVLNSTSSVERNKRLRNRKSNRGARIMNPVLRDSSSARHEELVEDNAYVDIPVTALRCAREMALDYNVVFEMTTKNRAVKKFSHMLEESVFLNTNVGSGGHRKYLYLRLPARNERSGRSKCEHTVDNKEKVCTNEFLYFYKQLCRSMLAESSGHNSSLPVAYVELCTSVYNALTYFCDTRLIYQRSEDDAQHECFSSFVSAENLFISSVYYLRPRVTFADGKTVVGNWIGVSPQTLPILHKNGIVVTDNKPEVRISKISVIPTDPVPQDIYQVRLDYTCATNQTVIRMNVTGSDLYRNHVTCTGVTECSCCILHAAGASDAVVDHVTINVTDSLSGVNTLKEMVVIF